MKLTKSQIKDLDKCLRVSRFDYMCVENGALTDTRQHQYVVNIIIARRILRLKVDDENAVNEAL